jgi:hypothetical protein
MGRVRSEKFLKKLGRVPQGNLAVKQMLTDGIHTASRGSSLPSNGSLFRFFLGEKMGQVEIFLGSAQDIGGKEGT